MPVTLAFCKVMSTGVVAGLPLTMVTTPLAMVTLTDVGASVLSPAGGLAVMFQVPSPRSGVKP